MDTSRPMRTVEVFGGLAPYCLHAMAVEAERRDGRRYRREPPVSRMGNKAGFVPNVLKAFGLTRVRWSEVWMNDLDPVCHLFHLIYASAPLRDAVARRLWAWVPCPVCAPDRVAEALAGTARYTREQCDGWGKAGCEECGGSGVQDARRLWERVRKSAVPDGVIERAAAAVFLQSRSFSLTPVSVRDGRWLAAGFAGEAGDCSDSWKPGRDGVATALEALGSGFDVQVRVTRMDAAQMLPDGDCGQTVVILDPPYEGTSGYQASSCRETVLPLARAWHEAGALVLLHEACPLADALGDGWQARPAGVLRARASTFWGEGGEREWLTFNRAPVWWPAIQHRLF